MDNASNTTAHQLSNLTIGQSLLPFAISSLAIIKTNPTRYVFVIVESLDLVRLLEPTSSDSIKHKLRSLLEQC
jgi:hypothetical protein